jgi:hypothetical protein
MRKRMWFSQTSINKNKIITSMAENLPYKIRDVPTNYSKGFVMIDKTAGKKNELPRAKALSIM